MRLGRGSWWLLALAAALSACRQAQIIESTEAAVTVRYDGISQSLADATAVAQKACGSHGKTARLRRNDTIALSERFAHFDCR